jgi:4-hydroxybenzoate polyprenyltransferase
MKKGLIRLSESLAYSNFIVAMGAASLGYINSVILALPKHQILVAFLFSSTFLIYNLQRRLTLSKNKRAETQLERWNEKHRNFMNILILLSLAISLYLYLKLPTQVAVIVIPLAVISFAYVLPFKNSYSLREMPYLKVLFVSFSWAGATVILPIMAADANQLLVKPTVHLLALAIMAFVFAESLPFDIRDIYVDRKNRLKTIPIGLGIKKSLYLSSFSFALALISMFYLYVEGTLSAPILICFALSMAVALVLFLKIKTETPHLYYAFFLESVLLLPLSFYLLIS